MGWRHSRRLLAAGVFVGALGTVEVSCGEPCEQLTEKICDELQDERACQKTKQDIATFNPETCKAALKIFDERLGLR